MICLEHAKDINLQGHAYENGNRKKHLSIILSKCSGETCERNQTKVDEYLNSLYIYIDGVFQNINFKERKSTPVYSYIRRLASYHVKTYVDGNDITGLWVFDQFQQNSIKTFDSFFNTGKPTFEHTYYDLGLTSQFPFKSNGVSAGGEGYSQQWAPGNLLVYEMYLNPTRMDHTRKAYDILDLISELGGVLNIVTTLAGLLIYSISEHSFIVRALQNLYLAKTDNI